MSLRTRVWVDNERGRFVRVRASDGPWVELPFEPVVQSMELARACLLIQQRDEAEHLLSAYAYDGTRLWRRAVSELPIASVEGGIHLSKMQTHPGVLTERARTGVPASGTDGSGRPVSRSMTRDPQSRLRDELRLNRGPAYCVIENAIEPRFGPLVFRDKR